MDEVNHGSIELSHSPQSHASFYHEIGSGDCDGKDGTGVVGVGEIPEPQRQGDKVAVELRDKLQKHVVLALGVCVCVSEVYEFSSPYHKLGLGSLVPYHQRRPWVLYHR